MVALATRVNDEELLKQCDVELAYFVHEFSLVFSIDGALNILLEFGCEHLFLGIFEEGHGLKHFDWLGWPAPNFAKLFQCQTPRKAAK